MSILGNRVLGGAGQQPYTVGRSLRFRSSATAYLNRTPSVTGSRQKFTWSAWVKRGLLTTGTYYQLFGAGPGAGGNEGIFFDTTAGGLYLTNDGPSTAIITSAVFRDPSAWYHIVCAVDTTQATAANRQIFYINGVQQTSYTGSYCAQNTNFTYINVSGVQHRMGAHTNSGYYFDGYMAEINYVDGQQLTPSSFGFYDNNGVWQPRKYGGTYGTNGFYTPFSSGFNTTQTYAGSFNGSNQFLSLAANAAFAPGTGDFTAEANVNFNALPATNLFLGWFENQIATTAANSDKFWVGLVNNGGTMQLRINQHNSANWAGVNWTPTVNTWYHIAFVRQSGTILIFINGVQQTVTNSTVFNGTNFSQNGFSVGASSNTGSPSYFNGYLSNARYVVGTAVYTTGFTPPSSNLTAVTNTQLLTLQNATIVDNSSAARTITNNNSVTTSLQYPFQYTLASIGSDASGNGNNWTPNNINTTILGTTYDSMIDSPTVSASSSNYAVLNPLAKGSNVTTLSEANLYAACATASTNAVVMSTMGASSGKWYAEFTANGSTCMVGVSRTEYDTTSGYLGTLSTEYGYYGSTGNKYNNASNSAYGATYTTGDVIGIALDIDGGTLTFYKNNVSQGTAYTGLAAGTYYFGFGNANTGCAGYWNFGQRPFTYTPPSGFNALNTQNLPQPTIMNGAKYMQATLYTGNGSSQTITQSVTGNNATFFPDFVWAKIRSASGNHSNYDAVRGAQQWISANLTNAEGTYPGVTAFNSNGFTIGSDGGVNTNAATYVGWQWNAGSGTTSTNTNGTISSLVSVNPSAGFSISAWTSNGVVGSTIGHGLGVAPNFMIVKPRASAVDWVVYHSSIGATGYLILNTTAASVTSSAAWNNVAPTSTVFTVGNGAAVNPTSSTMIGYFWSAVAGYSAFGSYTGNGSADGPFIYTGFRPRFIIVKRTTLTTFGDWETRDTSRDPYNYSASARLFPNSSAAEDSSGFPFDILSNGFKIRSTGVNSNESSQPYIYAAFAENPFKISRAR